MPSNSRYGKEQLRVWTAFSCHMLYSPIDISARGPCEFQEKLTNVV